MDAASIAALLPHPQPVPTRPRPVPDDLSGLAALLGATPRLALAGEVLQREGGPPAPATVIVRGGVALAHTALSGRRAIVAVLGPGDAIGLETALAGGPDRLVPEARTLAPSRLLVAEAGRPPPTDRPAFAAWAAGVLARRLVEVEDALGETLTLSVRDRVRATLERLAARHGRVTGDGRLVDLPLGQEALSWMVGATRESVNRALGSLRDDGEVRRVRGRYVLRGSS